MSEPFAPSALKRRVRAIYYFAAILLALVVLGVAGLTDGLPPADRNR